MPWVEDHTLVVPLWPAKIASLICRILAVLSAELVDWRIRWLLFSWSMLVYAAAVPVLVWASATELSFEVPVKSAVGRRIWLPLMVRELALMPSDVSVRLAAM